MIVPTYEQYERAADLNSWQARLRLIQERDELEEQRDAVLQLARIIVRHQQDLIADLLVAANHYGEQAADPLDYRSHVLDNIEAEEAIQAAERYLRHVTASRDIMIT